MTEEQKRAKMSELALRFPAMRGKAQAGANGIVPWNVLDLAAASRPWSPSEKLIVSFLATVWDADQEYVEPFNPVAALQRWDDDHFAAFKSWVDDPFYC